MYDKHCKAADIAKSTGINPSILSKYLSGANKPNSDNIIAISHYLNVSPEWLLSSSDAPESIQKSQVISSSAATEPLLKQIEDKNKIIELLEQMVADKDKQIAWLSKSCDALADEVRRWEEWKASSKERHTKGKAKANLPIANHKTTRKRKKWYNPSLNLA